MKPDATILLRRLESAGFFAHYALLGDGNFRPYDWEKMAGQMSGDFQALWRFFLLGDCLPAARLRKALGGAALDGLNSLNVCEGANGEMTLGSLSLVTFRGSTFFVDRGATPKAYFGDDTKALMTLLPKRDKGRCLCLYSNTSVALLPLASRSQVEITYASGPHHRDVVQANLCLNEAQGNPRFVPAPPPRGRPAYDIIVASCPSTFEPPGIRMPHAIAGGRDGRTQLQRLLATGRRLLAPDGCLLTTFLFFAEADSKAMREQLVRLIEPHDLGCRLLVCSKHLMQPGVPVFNMLFGLATAGKPAAAEAVAKKMLNHVRTMAFEAAYLIKGSFLPASAAASREIIDYSDTYYGSWTF
jgi:hypothetical protein